MKKLFNIITLIAACLFLYCLAVAAVVHAQDVQEYYEVNLFENYFIWDASTGGGKVEFYQLSIGYESGIYVMDSDCIYAPTTRVLIADACPLCEEGIKYYVAVKACNNAYYEDDKIVSCQCSGYSNEIVIEDPLPIPPPEAPGTPLNLRSE